MRTLYESLLDDEDILVNRADKSIFNEWKQHTIEFIKENYNLFNNRFRKLNIERYLKLDPKTQTVNIKTNKVTLLRINHLTDKGEIPVENFQWGEVYNMDIYGEKLKNLNNFPTKCNRIELIGCNIKNFEGISKYLNFLSIRRIDNIKNLKGLENIEGLRQLEIVSSENLESLKYSPNMTSSLSIWGCPKLKELIPLDMYQLNISNCPLLPEKEIDKIKCEIKYIN